jgi:ribose transport system substrate-binding protein
MRIRAGALCVLLLAGGCGKQQKERIAVIPMGRSHLYWQSIHAGAIAAARELNVDIVWNGTATETDYSGQLQIADAMINQRVDAIAIAPIDRTAMVSVVERAAREKIPVVIFDSGINTENILAQVSTDNYQGGVLGAERIGKILGGKGKVAMVAVQPGSTSTVLREQGFEETLRKEFPGIQIVDKRFGMADFAKSLAAAENMLTAHPDMDAMFASNETSTVGAAQALKGRKGRVRLVGFDSSPTLLDDLQSGLIDALVVQDPFKMGYESVQTAVKKLRGGTPEKKQNMPPLLVTKDNLNDAGVQKQLKPDLEKYLQ